ncbi:hypothetical protein [Clostridium sp. HBUAS56017]|uniref:hypothetical protein n=1 Tax=Clostridium sp. HBUAS56017 TaxID=2571128 RepID=UPI00117737FF|nr:hypothetical protein [Clostridium sp. HBUAS56017]
MLSFWELTLKEINLSIEVYQKRKTRDIKDRAYMDYKLAECIGVNISTLISKENEPIPFVEIYKELFEEEQEDLEEQKKQQQMVINKQRMIDFANFHNSKRKEVR